MWIDSSRCGRWRSYLINKITSDVLVLYLRYVNTFCVHSSLKNHHGSKKYLGPMVDAHGLVSTCETPSEEMVSTRTGVRISLRTLTFFKKHQKNMCKLYQYGVCLPGSPHIETRVWGCTQARRATAICIYGYPLTRDDASRRRSRRSEWRETFVRLLPSVGWFGKTFFFCIFCFVLLRWIGNSKL